MTYVTADLAGRIESPVYAIQQLTRALEGHTLPEGYGLEVFHASQPSESSRYVVVGWFQSFTTPLTIMLAIAGAGIVVRNSIILVDFIDLRVRDGMPLAEAVVDAGAVRFRPMPSLPPRCSPVRP